MTKFNQGRPYHGSDDVSDGRLTGRTVGTDYFYFMCPKCPSPHMLRVLDFGLHHRSDEHPYNDMLSVPANGGFTIAFKLYCEACKFEDFVKVSNIGWQGGDPEAGRLAEASANTP